MALSVWTASSVPVQAQTGSTEEAKVSDQQRLAAAAYSDLYGVDESTALELLEIQSNVDGLRAELGERFKGSYLGVQIQHRPFGIVVYMDPDQVVSKTFVAQHLGIDETQVEIRATYLSETEYKAFVAGIGELGIDARIEIQFAEITTISVFVDDAEQFSRQPLDDILSATVDAPASGRGELDAEVVVEILERKGRVEKAHSGTDIVGNHRLTSSIDGLSCTAGFGVVDLVSHQVGISTAGHCLDSIGSVKDVYVGGVLNQLTLQEEWETPGSDGLVLDFGWLTPAGNPEVTNRVQFGTAVGGGSSEVSIQSINDIPSAIGGGDFVCKDGYTSGATCGNITATGEEWQSGSVERYFEVEDDVNGIQSQPGDSGGAWMNPFTGEAFGTTVGFRNFGVTAVVIEASILFDVGNLEILTGPLPKCAGMSITHRGTNDGETITGTSGDDVIWAGGGNDIVNAGGGDDVICGGSGSDVINGGSGVDSCFGESLSGCELGHVDELLVYNASSGSRMFYDVSPTGALSPFTSPANWSSGYETVTGIDIGGDIADELLFYNRDSGYRAIYNVSPNGALSSIASSSSWNPGWDTVMGVNIGGDISDELILYDNNTGSRIWMNAFPSGNFSQIAGPGTWASGWDQIVGINMGGDPADELLFYDTQTGKRAWYNVSATGAITQLGATAYWAPGWTEITAVNIDSDAADELLFYKKSSGLRRYYDVSITGALTEIGGPSNWSTTLDQITNISTDND